MIIDRTEVPNDIKSYLKVNNSYSPLTTIKPLSIQCYDDYFCYNDNIALFGHVVIGVIGFLLCLIGIIANVLILPVLSLIGIRSSATSYMVAIAVTDLCQLIVNMILSVILYLPSSSVQIQKAMYQNFVAYFVPLGYPLKLLCQMLSFVLLICLMINRLYFMRNENVREIKIHNSWKVITVTVIFTIISKLPNFLLLRIAEDPQNEKIRILFNPLANLWMFIVDLVLFWLLFIILIIVLLLLIRIAFIKRAIPQITTKKFFYVSVEQRYIRRERIYFTITLCVAFITVLLNIPHFIKSVVLMNDLVSLKKKVQSNLVLFEQFEEISDIFYITLKPCVYLVMAIHFRKALCDMIGLWIRPRKYNELNVSGGIGKKIDLNKCNADNGLPRNDTANSLLKIDDNDKKMDKIVDEIAKDFVGRKLKSSAGGDNSSGASLETSSGIESQYGTPVL